MGGDPALPSLPISWRLLPPPPPPPIQLWGLQSFRSSQVTWPGRAKGALRRSRLREEVRLQLLRTQQGSAKEPPRRSASVGYRGDGGLGKAGRSRPPPRGRFPAPLVSRKSAPGEGATAAAPAAPAAGSGAPEACVPRPRGVCRTRPVRLALLQLPARPCCHQAERGLQPGSPVPPGPAGSPSAAL